jgi:alkyl hydroperoxide reductase subunit AhpF
MRRRGNADRMFLNDEVRAQIKERFAELVNPVRIIAFSQTIEHPESEEVRRLVEELASLDERLIFESKNFILEAESAAALKVHHIPGIAILQAGKDGAADMDFGVRFFGLPMQYDFGSLIDGIVDVSRGESGLSPETIESLKALSKPIHLQVFTTPT